MKQETKDKAIVIGDVVAWGAFGIAGASADRYLDLPWAILLVVAMLVAGLIMDRVMEPSITRLSEKRKEKLAAMEDMERKITLFLRRRSDLNSCDMRIVWIGMLLVIMTLSALTEFEEAGWGAYLVWVAAIDVIGIRLIISTYKNLPEQYDRYLESCEALGIPPKIKCIFLKKSRGLAH